MGAGNLLCFNNGVNRNYSSIDEITTPVDVSGNYTLVSGTAFGPTSLAWTYVASPPSSLYALDISGAQRLPNGNTLIDDGPLGTFTEVTSAGQVVWKYINPVTNTGPLHQGDSIPHNLPMHPDETFNSVFRVYRYPTDYSGFTGHSLTPGNFIEIYTGINDIIKAPEIQVFPNPFTNKITLKNLTGTESYEMINTIGQTIWSGYKIEQHDFSAIAPGLYFLTVSTQNSIKTIKLIKQ